MTFYKYNGFLNVYKESGWTSMDVCAKLKGILGVKRIGHAGTLDPMAEGVLPVAVGRATKDVDSVGHEIKEYRAGMLLGLATETEDITGEPVSVMGRTLKSVLDCANPEGKLSADLTDELKDELSERHELTAVSDATESESQDIDDARKITAELESRKNELPDEEAVRAAVMSFIGEYDQLTPKYSARKVNGKKLYEYARAGIEVERKRKHVEIFDITIDEINLPHVLFTVKCSQGTYIRTLCHDIGAKLGCGACMESLIRKRVGRFSIDRAIRISEIERLAKEGGLDGALSVEAPTAVAIGKFDGTHLGHQALLEELKRVAQKKKLRTCVIIFKFGKDTVLSDMDRKMKMAELGIDYCMEVQFTDKIKSTSAEDFLRDILIGKFNMKAIVAGEDVSFGRGRAGNAEFLKAHAAEYGYEVTLIKKVTIELWGVDDDTHDKVISSTLLRQMLVKGDMVQVTRLLGERYTISGLIIHGRHIGTDRLETPTINIAVPDDLILPPRGVYAAVVHIFDDKKGQIVRTMRGIANLGCAPTVTGWQDPEPHLLLETHVFGDIGDCYGKYARVELCFFIRREKKFADMKELKEQVTEHDIPAAEAFFESAEP